MKPIVVELLRCCEKNNGDYEVIGEAHWQILENALQGTDDLVIKIYGYKYSRFKNLLFHLISILLCGIPYLILSWYPKRKVLKYCKCSLKMADLIVVTDNEGTCKIEKVLEIDLNLPNYSDTKMRYFLYQHTRYIWLNDQATFINVQNLNDKMTVNLLMENTSGINKRQQEELTKLYGSNSIEVEVKSYWSLFINEVFNPFYLFQVFSIILWSLDEYYHYAGCVFLISAGSVITSLYQTKKLSLALRELVGASSANQAEVVRPGREAALVSASRLVPGDVLQLPPGGCVMPCDALLLTGTCIVNESMLTGESVPVMKSPPNMNSEYYSVNTHKRHTLFAGTKVIQTRFYGNNMVLAKVVRTGFYTSKGELVKSILFPKPIGFQFYKDAVKFVIFLFCLSAMGMVYCVWLYIERGSELKTILLRTLDIITIVVPPALPAAMTAGTVYSQRRLKRNQIFCISPPRINICGKMRLICFDKTGTLTEDGLDLYAVIPNSEDCFGKLEHHVSALPNKSPIMQALASCHSLTSIDGQLTGDPLDLKMFEATEWVLEEPGPENTRYDSLAPAVVKPATTNEAALQNEDLDPLTLEIPYEIGLIRRFHFSSTQQSMGVIARVLGQPQMLYFVKGAPEKVASMCRTLPENFSRVLNEYASKGFRVIALAYKKLERKLKWMDAQRVKREQIEVDLTFLGLLVMQNSLKPATTSVIRELYEARIRMVMVTGDNIMTAISVSRDCCMIPQAEKVILISHYIPNELEGGEHVTHCSPSSGDGAYRPELRFEVVGAPPSGSLPQVSISLSTTLQTDNYCFAMDGRTWAVVRQHYPDLMPAILAKGTVFGRFGPEQKTQLVMGLQGDDWVVGMCGDGANDCGALKAAHIGISLSQAEASVAAPFTSRVQDISCVKLLTLEGRCALSTSFAIFKYMALYSLIQFFSVLILYNSFSILGNMQFLYVDLILTTSLALAMGRTGPARVLATRSPPVSLVGPATTVPLLVQVVICLVIQLGAMYVLEMQTWFKAVEGGPDVEEVLCWENTVIFIVSSFQYLILAGVYSKGEPFRQPFCTNYHLLGTLVILTIFTTFLLFCPWKWLASFMEVEVFRFNETKVNIFRLYLLLMPLFHLILSAAVELAISDSMKLKELLQSLAPKKSQCDDRTDALAKQLETSPWLEVLHKESVAC